MTSEQLYATLVRLYPRQFREDFADDMVAAFGEHVARTSAVASGR